MVLTTDKGRGATDKGLRGRPRGSKSPSLSADERGVADQDCLLAGRAERGEGGRGLSVRTWRLLHGLYVTFTLQQATLEHFPGMDPETVGSMAARASAIAAREDSTAAAAACTVWFRSSVNSLAWSSVRSSMGAVSNFSSGASGMDAWGVAAS